MTKNDYLETVFDDYYEMKNMENYEIKSLYKVSKSFLSKLNDNYSYDNLIEYMPTAKKIGWIQAGQPKILWPNGNEIQQDYFKQYEHF